MSGYSNNKIGMLNLALFAGVNLIAIGCSANSADSSSSSSRSSQSGSTYESAYESSRENQRQKAYNTLRSHGLSPNEAESTSKILQQMTERDRQIRAGTYKRP